MAYSALIAGVLFWNLYAIALYSAGPRFESEVLPLLSARCITCHGGTARQSGLDLRTSAGALKGGDSGPAIVPGAAAKSLLIDKVVSGKMPPGAASLTATEIDLLRRWIDSVAPVRPAVELARNVLVSTLAVKCVACHGGAVQEGGLDLRTVQSMLKGGRSGPAIVPGQPDRSLIVQRIASGAMPPEFKVKVAPVLVNVRPVTPEELAMVREWIARGAPEEPLADDSQVRPDPLIRDQDRTFWAFQPPRRVTPPHARQGQRVRNAIDAFLLSALDKKQLSFAPESERVTLLRRAYLDLTGLPPEPAEVRQFLEDRDPDAYSRLIDRLLASPRYGERWGKHWLEAAGYSDSAGSVDADPLQPDAWRYRDYVIRAFNQDKPFDRFLVEQIAGDELFDWRSIRNPTQEQLDSLIATGFLRTAEDGSQSVVNVVPYRYNVIADQVQIFGSAVLGVTIGCARCHNHKYDPIPQRDYYRLTAIFQSAFNPYEWVVNAERRLDLAPELEKRQAAALNASVDQEIKKLEGDLKQLEENHPDFAARSAEIKKALSAAKDKRVPEPRIRALYDMSGAPPPAHILRRGDPFSPGDAVSPGTLSVLSGIEPYRIVKPGWNTSGRRLALARWLVQPRHPLTARVMVNRIWQHHFGVGLVASPDNFGHTGEQPTHPELLDWLVTEFVARGWSVKAIHRLIMNSSAYRQSSRIESRASEVDPDNKLLSRMPLRRMDSEELRDSILQIAGVLDPAPFGPPDILEALPNGEYLPKGTRRSVYALQRRSIPVTLLESFDSPRMNPNCVRRTQSTVATQALQLWNSEFARQNSRAMAERVLRTAGASLADQVKQVYLLSLSRSPAPREIQEGVEALSQLQLKWAEDPRGQPAQRGTLALATFCHIVLNSPEFIYID